MGLVGSKRGKVPLDSHHPAVSLDVIPRPHSLHSAPSIKNSWARAQNWTEHTIDIVSLPPKVIHFIFSCSQKTRKCLFPIKPKLGTLRHLLMAIKYLYIYHVKAISTCIPMPHFCPLTLGIRRGWQPPLSISPPGAPPWLNTKPAKTWQELSCDTMSGVYCRCSCSVRPDILWALIFLIFYSVLSSSTVAFVLRSDAGNVLKEGDVWSYLWTVEAMH